MILYIVFLVAQMIRGFIQYNKIFDAGFFFFYLELVVGRMPAGRYAHQVLDLEEDLLVIFKFTKLFANISAFLFLLALIVQFIITLETEAGFYKYKAKKLKEFTLTDEEYSKFTLGYYDPYDEEEQDIEYLEELPPIRTDIPL
jgi:hypothetical protein